MRWVRAAEIQARSKQFPPLPLARRSATTINKNDVRDLSWKIPVNDLIWWAVWHICPTAQYAQSAAVSWWQIFYWTTMRRFVGWTSMFCSQDAAQLVANMSKIWILTGGQMRSFDACTSHHYSHFWLDKNLLSSDAKEHQWVTKYVDSISRTFLSVLTKKVVLTDWQTGSP